MSNFSTPKKTGSLHNRKDRIQAAEIIKNGGVVGVYNRGVNALWLDAKNPKAISKLQKIKGEKRKGRPVALTISLNNLTRMIDFNNLSKDARQYLELSDDLKKELGSLCFIRVPLKNEYIYKVPKSSLSFDSEGTFWIQSWDPHGHDLTENLIELSEKLGVQFPAVSSMNLSGEPEIIDQNQGEKFCQENNISLYLRDEKANPLIQGSYTIITFSKKGIELTRDGNIPGKVIETIFGSPLITHETKLSNYLQKEFPQKLISGLSKKGIRMAILLYLEGRDPNEINEKVKSLNL